MMEGLRAQRVEQLKADVGHLSREHGIIEERKRRLGKGARIAGRGEEVVKFVACRDP